MLLEITVPWYPHWRNAIKPILLNFVKLQLTFLQNPWEQFFLLDLNRQRSWCRRVIGGNWWVFSLRYGSDKPVMRCKLRQFWKSLTFLCHNFSITTCSLSSIKLSVRRHFIAENAQKKLFCVPILTARWKWVFFHFYPTSSLKLIVFHKYELDSSHQKLIDICSMADDCWIGKLMVLFLSF